MAEQPDSKLLSVLGFIFHAAYFAALPLLFIWSLNTLFYCEIPFKVKTWLAGFILVQGFQHLIKSAIKSFVSSYDRYDEEDEEYEKLRKSVRRTIRTFRKEQKKQD